jgi:hypothetical protein
MRPSQALLDWTLFGAWAIAALAAFAIRPGALLEVALIGVAGALVVPALESTAAAWLLALVGLAFVLPLTNTWPARAWERGTDQLPHVLGALAAPSSLALLAAAAVALPVRADGRGRAPLALTLAAAGLAVGAFLAAVLSAGPGGALASAWLQIGVPIAIGWLILRIGPNVRAAEVILLGALAAAEVPCLVGATAYMLDFGIPHDSGDLAEGKVALARPHLLQEVTFGNVGHIAALAVILLPIAIVLNFFGSRRLVRAVGAASTASLVVVLLLMVSRFALLSALLAALGLAVLLGLRAGYRIAAACAAGFVLIALVLASPAVRNPESAAAGSSSPAQSGRPSPSPSPSSRPVESRSLEVREGAVRSGLRVAAHHLPFGVGSGRYPLYDPVHTAPHSLPLEVVAEDGLLAGLGLLALTGWLILALVPLLRATRGPKPPGFELRVACVVGALAFLTLGFLGGVPLLLGSSDVWTALLAVQVSLAAILARR